MKIQQHTSTAHYRRSFKGVCFYSTFSHANDDDDGEIPSHDPFNVSPALPPFPRVFLLFKKDRKTLLFFRGGTNSPVKAKG